MRFAWSVEHFKTLVFVKNNSNLYFMQTVVKNIEYFIISIKPWHIMKDYQNLYNLLISQKR
jgi:hypothetical protein